MFISKELITTEKTYYKCLLGKFERELVMLPMGCISKKRIHGKDYYYHQVCKTVQGRPKKGGKGETDLAKKKQIISKYLSKDNLELMAGIKRRRFIQKSLPQIKKNLKTLESLLDKYHPFDPLETVADISEIYSAIPTREHIVEDFADVQEWSDLKEESNNFFAENLRHITASGRLVRSKSEAIIADLLDANDILYKYEAEINIGNKKYYPDFAIIRKSDKRIIYWEHFGLVGDEDYANSMLNKINDYQAYGIILWDNFIMTSDSMEGNIDAKRINNMIKVVLLI